MVGGDLGEARLDLAFGLGVECRGGLVENQDLRRLEHDPGDRDALLLAARQFEAALADHGFVPVGQARDEIMDVGAPCRGLDFGAAGAGAAIGDVVVDGVVEQHGVLRHDADRAPEAVLRHAADILAVDLDCAVIDIVEAEQQARDRRFAGAARSDDGERGAGRHREIDVPEDRAR